MSINGRGIEFHLVESTEDVAEFLRWLGKRREILAFDTETGGLDWWREPLRMVQFGDMLDGWAIPWELWPGLVKEVFTRYDREMVGQNLKFDTHFLEHNGVAVKRHLCHDTRVMGHLLDPTTSTSLKPMAVRYVDPRAGHGQDELKYAFQKYGWTWRTVPYDYPAYWRYAALDTLLTAHVYHQLYPRVRTSYAEVYDLELACAQVLCDMERHGARVDLSYCEQTYQQWDTRITQLRQWCRDVYGVGNATSNHEVVGALQRQGVQLYHRTPTGQYKLDEEVLLGVHHPLAQAVLEIRKLTKLRSTYLTAFMDLADGDILHPGINPIGARTGRMSVTRPALQTLPRGREIRDAFIPRDGHTMILADFDQIELRLMAHFSGDEKMLEAIWAGHDLHAFTAQRVYGREEITREERQLAKNANFAKIYGAGVRKFALTAGVSFEVAEAFLRAYDGSFPGVVRFQHELVSRAIERRRTGGLAYVRSPVGRVHPLEEGKEYKGVNYLIQGTAADVLKQKIVELANAGLGEYLVLPVHDELVFDVPTAVADEVAATLHTVMEERDAFRVPLTAHVTRVNRWGEAYAA